MQDNNIKLPINLYDGAYGDEIPYSSLYVCYFNVVPSQHVIYNKLYSTNIENYFIENGFKVFTHHTSERMKVNEINDVILLINKTKEMFIELSYRQTHNNDLEKEVMLTFKFNRNKGRFQDQINTSLFEEYVRPKKKSNIRLVKSESGRMDTMEYELVCDKLDLVLNYGENFLLTHKKIEEKLNQKYGKGIVLLHGVPGSGKSTYLKYLTNIIEDKEILFIPPSMVEILSEPSIIPFLMEHKNSILIIEDAEKVISNRDSYTSSSAGVSNILNLTDGILGDCLSIQIIATFNMNKENIDPALLRKGRLIAEHKFDKLSVDDSNKLLKSLDKDYTTSEPMSLADIYYVDETEIKVKNKTKIGFN